MEKIWLIGNCRDDPPVLAAVACASTAGTGELPTPSSTTAGATTPANPREPKISRRAISAFARQIAKQFNPHKIILFGSYAYGVPTGDSDVDILVIMPFD